MESASRLLGFGLALVVNVIIGVWFVTSSQAAQDVKIESHEERIKTAEKAVSLIAAQSVSVARLEEQIKSVNKGQEEIKHLIESMRQEQDKLPSSRR